jgi:O-antigen/teichoic acid export membrane protein
MLKQLGINSFWILVTRLSNQVLSVLFIAIIARGFGADGLGQFTILAATVFIGNVFTTFGTDALLIREMAPARHFIPLASTVLWVQISLSVAWCLMMIIVALFPIGPFSFRLALVAYNFALFPMAFFSVVTSTLRALERLHLYMGINLYGAVLQVLGTALLVRSSGSILSLSMWLFLVQIATASMGLLLCRVNVPMFSLKMKPIMKDVLAVIRSVWRLALFSPVGLFSQRLNFFVLSALSGDVATGWLSAATRLVEGVKAGHFALLNGLMPEMSRPATAERERILRSSLIGLLFWSLIPAIIITVFAEPVILLIYGQAFAPSVTALRIVIWSLIPYSLSSYFSVTLSMRGEEAVVLKANITGLIGSVMIYLLLIPVSGLLGAAWSVLAVETLLALLLLMQIYQMQLRARHAI